MLTRSVILTVAAVAVPAAAAAEGKLAVLPTQFDKTAKGMVPDLYDDYLGSPEWDEKRQARLRMDDYACGNCGGNHGLQVHHCNGYEHVGNEALEELVTLCDRCHGLCHRDYSHLRGVKTHAS